MEAYDSPRNYRIALGRTLRGWRFVPTMGFSGMSPVTLSTRLMVAIDRGRAIHPGEESRS
jgi:hypothetical protein